jgi:stearoyl-CoA desaturase (delta-9 desaturase)
MGELFQNNHHRASGRFDFAARRFEFDPTAAILRVLARMRVIQLRGPVLEPALESAA